MSHFTASLNITFDIAWLCRHVTGTFQMSGRRMNTGINDDFSSVVWRAVFSAPPLPPCRHICFTQTASLQ